jgi:uncharacterized protein YbjT (DUF2867 family)
MKVAVTGGSGFVGRRLLAALEEAGHETVSIARGVQRPPSGIATAVVKADVGDAEGIRSAISGCDAVVHLAGINRKRGKNTFRRVHVEGTQNVVNAARVVGVNKIVLLSFLKARADAESEYHDTKYEAEMIVADSGLDFTILKAGIIFGPGDGMLTNLWRGIKMLPVFATVGLFGTTLRPVWVGDVVKILCAALTDDRLSRQTVSVLGPEEITLREAVRRVALSMDRPVVTMPLPVAVHYFVGWIGEKVMRNPLVTVAQVKMLAEGVSEPLDGSDPLPFDLEPQTRFDAATIIESLPQT